MDTQKQIYRNTQRQANVCLHTKIDTHALMQYIHTNTEKYTQALKEAQKDTRI